MKTSFTKNLLTVVANNLGINVAIYEDQFSGCLRVVDIDGTSIGLVEPRLYRTAEDICQDIVNMLTYYKNQLDMWSGKSPNVYS